MAERDLTARVRVDVDDAQPIEEIDKSLRDLDSAGRKARAGLDQAATGADRADREIDQLEQQVRELSRALDRAERDLAEFKREGQGIERLTSSVAGLKTAFAGLGIGIGIETLRRGIALTVEKSREQVEALAQVQASIKSTGGAAGLTAPEIAKIAAELQKVTTVGDEVTLRMESVLLTFTKIGKEIFPRASEVILDVAKRLGTDLNSAAIQVGKALNDPVLGITALQRAGIQFSDSQKETIKTLVETGNVVAAQRVILEELETQFGGSARAARDTFGGAMDAAANTAGDLLEKIGEGGLNDALKELADQLNSTGPELEETFEGIGKVLGTLLITAGAFAKGVKAGFVTIALAAEEALTFVGSKVATLLDIFAKAAQGVGQADIANAARQNAENLREVIQDFQAGVREDSLESLRATKDSLGRDLAALERIWTETGKAASGAAEGIRAGVEALGAGASPAETLSQALARLAAGLRDLEKVRLVEEKKKIQELLDGYKKLGAEAPPELLKLAQSLDVVDSETEALLKKQAEKVKEFVAEIKAAMGGLSEDQVRDAQAIREAWEQIDPTELRNRFAALGDAARSELREKFESDVAAIKASGGEVSQELVVVGQQIGALVSAYDPVSAKAQSAADAMRAQAAAAAEAKGSNAEAAAKADELAQKVGAIATAAAGAGEQVKGAASRTSEAAVQFSEAATKVGEGAGALDKQATAADSAAGKLGQASSAAKDVTSSQDALASATSKAVEELGRIESVLERLKQAYESIRSIELSVDVSGVLAGLESVIAKSDEARASVASVPAAAENA